MSDWCQICWKCDIPGLFFVCFLSFQAIFAHLKLSTSAGPGFGQLLKEDLSPRNRQVWAWLTCRSCKSWPCATPSPPHDESFVWTQHVHEATVNYGQRVIWLLLRFRDKKNNLSNDKEPILMALRYDWANTEAIQWQNFNIYLDRGCLGTHRIYLPIRNCKF